ncbi:MAG: FtsW/RodA/SpoVE family cell cycle protein [Bacteroidales bacterium]|nr:FtsW/RodA/SpoVE family cell cycle protein [Bacteroidales bacterium]
MKKLTHIFKGDKVIWIIFILLSIVSLIAVYSAIGRTAVVHGSTPLKAFAKHALFIAGAYILILITSNIDYRRFSRISQVAYILIVGLLAYMLITKQGRWINLRFFQFQPSEFAKVILIVLVARVMAVNQSTIQDASLYRKLLVVVLVVCGLILPENLSTFLILFVTCFIMMRFGGVNTKLWNYSLAVLLVAAAIGGLMMASSYNAFTQGEEAGLLSRSSTWGHRIHSWLNPNPEELTQENMARMAVASGGFLGVGVGNTVHARLMTQADNDFIYSIIIEETGSATAIILLIVYCIFFFRCLWWANQCKGLFGSLILIGCSTLIFLQAAVHMCVSVGALPVTGQTLPLISSGGSAYLSMGLAIGAIQSVINDIMSAEKARQDKIRSDAEFTELQELDKRINNADAQ